MAAKVHACNKPAACKGHEPLYHYLDIMKFLRALMQKFVDIVWGIKIIMAIRRSELHSLSYSVTYIDW